MSRSTYAAAAVLLAASLVIGCGTRGSPALDGSSSPDQQLDLTIHHDLPHYDLQPALDQQQPDQQVLDLAAPPPDHGPCVMPTYPSDCSQVSNFQCGFGIKCINGDTLQADWHEHVFCGSMEQGTEEIESFTCTYVCPKGCVSNWSGWPQDGADLVKQACNP